MTKSVGGIRGVALCCMLLTLVSVPLLASGDPEVELPEEGVLLEWKDGGWLHVWVGGARFELSFYDEEGELVEPVVVRGRVRVQSPASGQNQWVLFREGKQLFSPRQVRPPHVFAVSLFLFREADREPYASHHFQYP